MVAARCGACLLPCSAAASDLFCVVLADAACFSLFFLLPISTRPLLRFWPFLGMPAVFASLSASGTSSLLMCGRRTVDSEAVLRRRKSEIATREAKKKNYIDVACTVVTHLGIGLCRSIKMRRAWLFYNWRQINKSDVAKSFFQKEDLGTKWNFYLFFKKLRAIKRLRVQRALKEPSSKKQDWLR